MIEIADIFGMLGMGFFLTATLKQWHKIYKTQHTTAISLTLYKLKIVAILCTMICVALVSLPLSFIVLSMELIVSIGIIHMLKKYKQMKSFTEMTGEEFTKEIKSW